MINKKKKTAMYILMVLITLLVVFPFIWMLVLSFKTNSEILSAPLSLPNSLNVENYRNAFKTLDFLSLYGNTLFVCVISLVIELIITFFSSFVLSRMEFKNRKVVSLIYGFLIMGLSISPFILLFPVYKINVAFGLRGLFALIFPYVATSISFNTLLLVGYLKSLPTEIDEAAVIDGCSIWDLMLKVILPMAKPAVATLMITDFLATWNEYLLATIIITDNQYKTVPVGLMTFVGEHGMDYGYLCAGVCVSIIPVLIVYLVFQRHFVEGMAGAVKA